MQNTPFFKQLNWIEQHPFKVLSGFYLLCVLTFLATLPIPRVDGQLIGSDGVYYYAYLPSLLLDHSLNLSHTYSLLLPENTLVNIRHTVTGLLPNDYAVGPAVLWIPFFLAAHAIALLLNALGFYVATNGVSYLYQGAVLIGSITYGCAGLMLMFSTYKRFFSRLHSLLTVLAVFSLTNVLYYMVIEGSMSHMCSLFSVSLLLWLWLRFRPSPTLPQWALIGAAGGLVMMVRLPDATFLALPVLDYLMDKKRWRHPVTLLSQLSNIATLGVSALVVFSPQMIVWQALNGSPVISGYLVTDQPTFYWLRPQLVNVLVSTWHGLWLWHPVTFVATVGIIWLYSKDKRLTILVALGFISQIYVIGAWRDWAQGDSFGGRMFIASLPFLGLGLAAFIEQFASGSYNKAFTVGTLSLLVWNLLFLLQYRLSYIPMDTPISIQQLTIGKFEMLIDLMSRAKRAL